MFRGLVGGNRQVGEHNMFFTFTAVCVRTRVDLEKRNPKFAFILTPDPFTYPYVGIVMASQKSGRDYVFVETKRHVAIMPAMYLFDPMNRQDF